MSRRPTDRDCSTLKHIVLNLWYGSVPVLFPLATGVPWEPPRPTAVVPCIPHEPLGRLSLSIGLQSGDNAGIDICALFFTKTRDPVATNDRGSPLSVVCCLCLCPLLPPLRGKHEPNRSMNRTEPKHARARRWCFVQYDVRVER